MKISLPILAAALLLAGCSQYQKTPSGLAYKITGNGKNKLKNGQFVKMNVEFRVGPKDSVLNSTYGHLPAYLLIDTAHLGKHNFTEVLTQCAPGDRLDFVLSVDTLKKMNMITDYSRMFPKGGSIRGKADIIRTFANEQETTADYQKELEAERVREVNDVASYVNKKGIKAQKTEHGAYVEVQNAGDAFRADSGRQVSVMYRGTLLDNGKMFDANMGSDAQHKEPFVVVIGTHGSIQGMEEGLKYFGKGGRGRIFVPALLAYGPQGQPPVIPAYANLAFDVQVLDVTMPAPTPAPAAPAPLPKKK